MPHEMKMGGFSQIRWPTGDGAKLTLVNGSGTNTLLRTSVSGTARSNARQHGETSLDGQQRRSDQVGGSMTSTARRATHGHVPTVSAGTANINTNAGSAAARNLSVNANSTTNFGSTQHLNNLSIGAGATATLTSGGSKVLVSNVPTIAGATGAWTGTIDLKDNDAAFQSSAANKIADFNRLYDQLKSGYAAAAGTARASTARRPRPTQTSRPAGHDRQ
jgi:hypothetical protein